VLERFYDADGPGMSVEAALPEEAAAGAGGGDTDCGIGSAA
jgi:hypothetical protein